MHWWKVVLTEEDIFVGQDDYLQAAFAGVFVGHGLPKDAAMFRGIGHSYYFSPGAIRIAGSLLAGFSGTECEAPAESGLVRLVDNGVEAIPFCDRRSSNTA